MNKEYLLTKSKVFCMAPWIHMHIWPNGRTMPCCVTNSSDNLGNIHKNTIKELWNSEGMRKLRKDLLSDTPSNYCTHCYEIEKTNQGSLRTSLNQRFGNSHFDKVESTKQDGSHYEPNFVYMDVRFSNICNLKCRTCNPTWSSSWYDDFKKAHGNVPKDIALQKYIQITNKKDLLNEILELINCTETVYWAGGEPFITEEHWYIMDYWVNNDKAKNIYVDYTTNFSQIKYKNRVLFELWEHFKLVQIHASLDGSWKKGEYIRKGLDWNQIIDNRKEMIKNAPNIKFEVTPTVSILNAMHLPDFHKEWLEEELINKPEDFRFNWLFSPDEFCIKNAPLEYKHKIMNKWQKHKAWLIDNNYCTETNEIINWIDGLENFMFDKNQGILPSNFLNWGEYTKFRLDMYDKIRKESWQNILPELIDIAK